MRHFALAALGHDRPGIVAGITEALLGHRVNLEDSRMGILRGHFSMVLVLSAPDDIDAEALRRDLSAAGERLGLEAVWVSDVDDAHAGTPAPTHLVSVYGSDHPGIVNAIAETLAQRGATITDLQTRLLGEGSGEPLYAMTLEVAWTGETGEIEAALVGAARAQGVEITVRALDDDVL